MSAQNDLPVQLAIPLSYPTQVKLFLAFLYADSLHKDPALRILGQRLSYLSATCIQRITLHSYYPSAVSYFFYEIQSLFSAVKSFHQKLQNKHWPPLPQILSTAPSIHMPVSIPVHVLIFPTPFLFFLHQPASHDL